MRAWALAALADRGRTLPAGTRARRHDLGHGFAGLLEALTQALAQLRTRGGEGLDTGQVRQLVRVGQQVVQELFAIGRYAGRLVAIGAVDSPFSERICGPCLRRRRRSYCAPTSVRTGRPILAKSGMSRSAVHTTMESDADAATNTCARPKATGASGSCCQQRIPTAATRLPTRCISQRANKSPGPAELR